jgi:two-component system, cell cycle response regulator
MGSYYKKMSKSENSRRKILAVDDDPESVKIVKMALEYNGYQVESATSGEDALSKITQWHPHLVLLDVNMPGLNGLQTLQFLRSNPTYVSTIFVSAQDNPEDVIRGLDAGADDYICKPFNPSELLARIRCHLRIKDIRDELNRANGKLKELVDIDDLTGLYNMRSLYQKLDYELERAARHQRKVAVIMMDMDDFKNVNDENDHLFGSFVLTEVGGIIKHTMRRVDFAARYGGDEFLIILTDINLEGALTFAERLRQTVANTLFKNDKHQKKLTASIGIAITDPSKKSLDSRTVIRFADRALYDAKEGGRNCVHFYDFSKESGLTGDHPIDPQTFRRSAKG